MMYFDATYYYNLDLFTFNWFTWLQIDLEFAFEEFEHGITVSFDDHFCTKSTVQSRELTNTMVQQQAEIKL